jgi:hypothetical protein
MVVLYLIVTDQILLALPIKQTDYSGGPNALRKILNKLTHCLL